MKKVGGRLALLTLVVMASLIFFIPSYQPFYQALPGWLKQVLPSKGITLGLDLQGGIHLVMEVDEDRAIEIAVDRAVVSLQDVLVDKKIPVESVARTGPTQVTIQFQDAELKAQIQKLINDYPIFSETESAGSVNRLIWELRENEAKRIKDSAINQALETIRNRIDQFGVAEPIVQRQGLKQIVVQLPGVKEPKRARDLIKETASGPYSERQRGGDSETVRGEAADRGSDPFRTGSRQRHRQGISRSLPREKAGDVDRRCTERCTGLDWSIQRSLCVDDV
jgi:preprotein translocase subunit SecD